MSDVMQPHELSPGQRDRARRILAERIADMQAANGREYVDLDALESATWLDAHERLYGQPRQREPRDPNRGSR
jgi:hypothetical protein